MSRGLTEREAAVLERIADGHSQRAIAADLGISRQAVRQAAQWARANGAGRELLEARAIADAAGRQRAWRGYLAERNGTYFDRLPRFAAVLSRLDGLGLKERDLIVDVGAGSCEFDRFLREEYPGLEFKYLPVDGAVQGVDLDSDDVLPLMPPAEWYVAIEVLEHLKQPARMIAAMQRRAAGIVVTTPHTDALGEEAVRAMDRTHVSPLRAGDLEAEGFSVSALDLFGCPDGDTIVGWWYR